MTVGRGTSPRQSYCNYGAENGADDGGDVIVHGGYCGSLAVAVATRTRIDADVITGMMTTSEAKLRVKRY